jgi:fatty-acyl-CoA synthase
MGLVGMVMAPMVAQVSVDYLATRDFAIRPLQWLRLISRNRATVAFSQPFGLKLCTLRVRDSDLEDLDLSSWRAAGVGAEMIRPETLRKNLPLPASTRALFFRAMGWRNRRSR